MTALDSRGLSLRALLSRLITELPDLNDRLAEQVSALSVAYPPGDPDAHPLTGTRAPALAVGDRDLFSLLRADSHLLLDLTAPGRSPFDAVPRPGVHLHRGPLDRPPPEWAEVRAALIRPDGHVAWATTATDDTVRAREATALVGR